MMKRQPSDLEKIITNEASHNGQGAYLKLPLWLHNSKLISFSLHSVKFGMPCCFNNCQLHDSCIRINNSAICFKNSFVVCIEEVKTSFQSCVPLQKHSNCWYKYSLLHLWLVGKLEFKQLIQLVVLTLFLVNKSFQLCLLWTLLHSQLNNVLVCLLSKTHF